MGYPKPLSISFSYTIGIQWGFNGPIQTLPCEFDYSCEIDCKRFLSILALYAISAFGRINSAGILADIMLMMYQPRDRTGVITIIVRANHIYKFPSVAWNAQYPTTIIDMRSHQRAATDRGPPASSNGQRATRQHRPPGGPGP